MQNMTADETNNGLQQNGMICQLCKISGCDVSVVGCGCCFHARCCPVSVDRIVSSCPHCGTVARSLRILPMAFDDIDQAQREASSSVLTEKRGKKRKNATIARLSSTTLAATAVPVSNPTQLTNTTEDPESSVGLRSGRWTDEEAVYCDMLIELFEKGQLPIPDGIKLNDFLSGMFKSKQSRLTKKMKNARLSVRMYKRENNNVISFDVAVAVSKSEAEFFNSIKCTMERSEIRFHMQREWREMFTSYCTAIGQPVDAYQWMKSDEELDRRISMQLDAARMSRRKIMMGLALERDTQSTTTGVFINTDISTPSILLQDSSRSSSPPTSTKNSSNVNGSVSIMKRMDKVRYYSSAFIKKVLQFLQRNGLPFEFCDVWVPSFTVGSNMNSGAVSSQKCRLFFAGFGVTEYLIPENGEGPAQPMSNEDFLDYLSFGEYSEKFSFDVGCGLPGRVYTTGEASWEQFIQNAPKEKFERKGGAEQWGIHTALGIPISSPSVERIVAVFYSRFNRIQNLDLVEKLCTEISSLMPTPRWHLVVDVGASTIPSTAENRIDTQKQIDLLRMLEVYMPKNKYSPLSLYLPGFTSLRLLLVKDDKSEKDFELLHSILISYDAHVQAGRSDSDVIAMTARDFMFLTRHGRIEGASNTSIIVANSQPSNLIRKAVTPSNDSLVSQLSHGQSQYLQTSVPGQQNLIQQDQLTMATNSTGLLSPLSPTQFYGHETPRNHLPSVRSNSQHFNSTNGYGKLDVAESRSSFHPYQSSGQEGIGRLSPLMFDIPQDNFGFFLHENHDKYF